MFANNNISLLHDIKRFLTKNFKLKDLSDTFFFNFGIQRQRDQFRGILGLSLKNYIEKILKRYGKQDLKPSDIPVATGDKFSVN